MKLAYLLESIKGVIKPLFLNFNFKFAVLY
jgi:hypothetical protein